MASNPRTPPRPVGRPGPTPQASAPSSPPRPVVVPSVLEIEITHPIEAVGSSEATTTIRFRRPPGLGELDGWLDETNWATFVRSLEVLPFRPGWIVHVLTQCAGVSEAAAKKVPARDMLTIGVALAPFVSGLPSIGESAPPGSLGSSDGGPETSES